MENVKVLMLRPGRTEPSTIHPDEVQNYLAGGYTFYELPAEDEAQTDALDEVDVDSKEETSPDSQEEPKKKKRVLKKNEN